MNDAKERFTERVADYVRYRPAYAPEIIDAVLAGFTAPAVADLGAGTGISSHLLAQRGARVFAVEPNAAMRSAIVPGPRITIVDGSAETTNLPDGSVDVVAAFQAYHWFDHDAVLREAQRIVRRDGRFAAVWNTRDRRDPFTEAYEAIVDRYDESGARHRSPGRNVTTLDDLRRHGWRNPRVVSASHTQRLDADAVIGFARSASYLPKSGAAYDAMASEMLALYDRWPEPAAFTWITEAYLAERPLE